MEAVVAHAISRYGDAGRGRIEAIEHIRKTNAITLTEPATPSADGERS